MNRRDFIRYFAAAALAVSVSPSCNRQQAFAAFPEREVPVFPKDENLVAIFSDTHLHGPDTTQHVVRFNQCVHKIVSLNPQPSNLLIYGDVAYLEGKREEYELFRRLIAPIEQAGIHWEIAMGNHDRIANYRQIFPERFATPEIVKDRYINIVKTPRADFILLDSYQKDAVPGYIEPQQKDWLAETLKGYADKPVFVGCHHPLRETELADTLKTCPKTAAYLHGHNHWWRNTVEEQVQTLCFPSTGHWGDMGFVLLNLSETDALFTPFIDAYEYPAWSKYTRPETNVEKYLERLNASTLTVKLP